MYTLGISAFYHDSAACLLKGGEIIAGSPEERFSRIKHDSSFPINAINFCTEYADIDISEIKHIVFYEKPLIKFERIMNTFAYTSPKGYKSFIHGMPDWIKNRLWTRNYIKKKLNYNGEILFTEHHESHAASSFFVSPFKEAAILTVDGIGEWASTTLGYGQDNNIDILKEIHFPHSLGLLYSTFTAYLGFKVNSGEYKVMGMSAYGKPKYYNTIIDKLINVKNDGSFALDMKYFKYLYSQQMYNEKFNELFNYSKRKSTEKIEQIHFDIAASIQKVTEEVVLGLLSELESILITEKNIYTPNLCIAGGVALNSVCNKRVIEESHFPNLYIQPDAGDGGGALGCAKFVYHSVLNHKRIIPNSDEMKNAYLGSEYSEQEIKDCLDSNNIKYRIYNQKNLVYLIAKQITKGNIQGIFHGRMEWGPRALGNRSIIADPRNKNMKDILNSKIKYREEFRPFAPSVLLEHWKDYFEIKASNKEYPYMLILANVREDKRDKIPAVTHVDGTARIQTIKREDNEFYYNIIHKFFELTKVPIVLNTSFNIRGEPIVCTPQDAVNTFLNSGMDNLIIKEFMVNKSEQTREKREQWKIKQKEYN